MAEEDRILNQLVVGPWISNCTPWLIVVVSKRFLGTCPGLLLHPPLPVDSLQGLFTHIWDSKGRLSEKRATDHAVGINEQLAQAIQA